MVLSTLYFCRYTRTALFHLRKSPKREQIINLMTLICSDPYHIGPSIKTLQGNPESFRRRHGDWRVSYRINDRHRSVQVFEITKRVGADK
jgi:mRNA-degrading endonuclease RelE of RelBE toxin-antitoxin system